MTAHLELRPFNGKTVLITAAIFLAAYNVAW
jgi:hypothetical protein